MIIYLTNIIKLYMIIRSVHGVYVSFIFLKWIILTTYTSLLWILSYIPILKPPLQLTGKELYNEIAPVNGSPETVQKGFMHFKTYCISCHSINGIGSDRAHDLNDPNVNLSGYLIVLVIYSKSVTHVCFRAKVNFSEKCYE